jgi:hypothetical protein
MKNARHIVLGMVGLMMILAACSPEPQGLDATATYVISNVLATRTAQAARAIQNGTPDAQNNNQPIHNATPLRTPGLPDTILFFDDFSDPTSGWEEDSEEEGGRSYAEGGYQIYVSKPELCYWTSIYRTFSDIVIEVDAQKTSGTEDNEFGIITRFTEDSDFYYYGISSDGYYGIGKFIDEKWINLGQEGWGFNDKVIKPGQAINHIKATANYENLTLEVNGQVLMDLVDPELRSGDVGLYVCSNEDETQIQFDNFRVSKP